MQNLLKGLRYITRYLTISDAWDLGVHPWKIRLLFNTPCNFKSSIEAIIAIVPGLTIEQAKSYLLELFNNNRFHTTLNAKMIEKRLRCVNYTKWNEFLYMTIRFFEPRIVFETGVFDGQSSAIILQALDDNKKGVLVSIDLPAVRTINRSTSSMDETSLPFNSQPGWLIPDYLRDRHELIFGDSKELLPQLFKKYPNIDIFFHDSLHSFEHQLFEYTTAWPHISNGGLLLSDDIFFSPAFAKFAKEMKQTFVRIDGFGAIRK